MDIIVGTAGHIDHGKTALIKALTGVDADRLPEEKQRGITIDLGFAELDLGSVHIGFVDVPGHERFVKNMLAGASGIDIVLLVVAADEGVMPQTREHFEICRLLGVENAIIVLNKTDLADNETLEMAKLDVAELVSGTSFENATVVCVSARTGDGVETLRNELTKVASRVGSRENQIISLLSVDRSFSVKGFGAVVTGTLGHGRIDEGAEMQLLPNGFNVRVRGIQVHGKSVKSAFQGQRVAVNLGGIDHSKVERGMVLAEAGILRPTHMIDADIEVLASAAKPLRTRHRVRVHIGTVEVLARIQVLNEAGEIEPGKRDYVQLRFESPVVAVPGDRFILRSYSPQITVAGGSVLDNAANKHRGKEISAVRRFLNDLTQDGDSVSMVSFLIANAPGSWLTIADLQARTGFEQNVLRSVIAENIRIGSIRHCGETYVAAAEFESLIRISESVLADFHKKEPLEKGITREALRDRAFTHLPNGIFLAALAALESKGTILTEKDTVRLSVHQAELSPREHAFCNSIASTYAEAGLAVPKLDEVLTGTSGGLDQGVAKKLFARFLDSGEIVKVTEEFYFDKNVIAGLISTLRKRAAAGETTIDVAQFKDLAGVSRKYAIPLLEYFDRTRVTARSGDKRVIL